MTGSRVLSNTLSQSFGKAIVVLASLVTTAFLTRVLGISKFGDYVFLTSIVLLFVGLSDLGVTIIGVREASSEPNLKPKIFGGIFFLRIIYSIFIFFVFNFLVLILPQFSQIKNEAFIASFVFPFLVLRTTMQAFLQANLRLDLSSFFEVVASLFFMMLLAVFVLLKIPIPLSSLMIFWVVSAFVSGIWSWAVSAKAFQLNFSFDKTIISSLFRQSLPLGFYLLIYSIYDRGIDSFFLKTFIGSQDVGLYGLAYKIHGNLIFGAAFLMNSLFPIISSLKSTDEKIQVIFKKSFLTLALSGLMIIFFGFIFSPLIINVLAGSDYSVSANILRILLFATFFSFLNHLCGYLMISLKQQKTLFYFSLISFLINLILNYLFIPKYSYWAAAVITVITEGTIFFLAMNFLKNKFRLQFSLKDIKKYFLLLINQREKYYENLS